MGRVQKKVTQTKGAQKPAQCTDTDPGSKPRWVWSLSQQQFLLKSASSRSQVHAVSLLGLDIGCRSKKLSERLSHSLSDEGVAVYTNEQVITGDHSCSVENEQCSANCKFSDERPINITDEIPLVASPHANSEQAIRQEVTHPQYWYSNSKICTGLQPLPLPPTYHSIHSSQSHCHCGNNDHFQLPMLSNLPDFEYSDHHLEVRQALIREGKRSEDSCYYPDLQRGPFYYKSHYVSQTFCRYCIQETFQRLGNHELVLSNSITFCPSFHRHKSTHYTHTQLSAFEKPELYIKPFIILAPDHE